MSAHCGLLLWGLMVEGRRHSFELCASKNKKLMQDHNKWNFDGHEMGNWNFYSRVNFNEETFFKISIILLHELRKSNLISYSIKDENVISELTKNEYEKRFCLLDFLNEFDETFAFKINMFQEGELKEKCFNGQQIKQVLSEINHYAKNKDYVPNPISVKFYGLSKPSICISINWDIFFEYVFCEPKWKAKYDDNDLCGPDEPVNYRKHAFNNVELAKLNGTKLNLLIKALKSDRTIQNNFTFEHELTDHWIGYHSMTNSEGVILNE